MSERLKFLGHRQELEMEKRSLEIRIQGLIRNLRDALDPLADIDELRPDDIGAWSKELGEARTRYRLVLEGLKKINDILGK
jgi:hypothetical protein